MERSIITGVVFDRDLYQETEEGIIEIKAGKTYPITKESSDKILLTMDGNVASRVYIADVNGLEICLYAYDEGNGFNFTREENIID